MYVHYELVQHRGERDNAFSGFNFANFELEIRVETLQRITKLFKRFFFFVGGSYTRSGLVGISDDNLADEYVKKSKQNNRPRLKAWTNAL